MGNELHVSVTVVGDRGSRALTFRTTKPDDMTAEDAQKELAGFFADVIDVDLTAHVAVMETSASDR